MNYAKLILYTAILSAIGGSYYLTYSKGDSSGYSRAKTEYLTSIAASVKAQQIAEKKLESERALFTQKLKDADNETDKLRADLNSGKLHARVRVNCHMPTVATSTGGNNEPTGINASTPSGILSDYAELSKEAVELRLQLEERVKKQDAWMQFCRSTVIARSAKF